MTAMVPIPLSLLGRICAAFLDMREQGAVCRDPDLMRDLDRALDDFDKEDRGAMS